MSAPDTNSDSIVLKSSDDVYLPASRALLSLASPVLRETLALPTEEWKDYLPVFQLSHHSHILAHLISLCGQKWEDDPLIDSLSEFGEVMAAVKAYNMSGVMQTIEALLMKSSLVTKEALGTYAFAKHFGFPQIALAAAKHTLSLPPFTHPYHPGLDNITAGDYARLQTFYVECQQAFRRTVLPNKSIYRWITRDSLIWFTCNLSSCAGSKRVLTGGGSRILAKKWWFDYIKWIHIKISQTPSPLILFKPEAMNQVISGAGGCTVCREGLFPDVTDFNNMLLAELDRDISIIWKRLFPSIVTTDNTAPAREPATVLQMFNDSNADFIIRTSDNVCFRTHKLILSLSVPIFATMFTLPHISNPLDQPEPTDPTAIAALVTSSIVDVSERSETMQLFLQLCYPATDPDIKTLAEVQEMFEVATKYETDGIKKRIAKLLEKFLKQNSAICNIIEVYAIAHRYKLERDVRLAAKQSLQRPLAVVSWYQHSYEASKKVELDSIPASAYYRLQDYYLRCRAAASKTFLTSNLSWVTASDTRRPYSLCGLIAANALVRLLSK